MTSTLIENLVERVSQNRTVLPHILFEEIANTLNERFHNYHVVDSLDEIDWAFCSEHFMYESFRERVTVEEKPDRINIASTYGNGIIENFSIDSSNYNMSLLLGVVKFIKNLLK